MSILFSTLMLSCNNRQDSTEHDSGNHLDNASTIEETSLQYVTRATNQIVLGNQKYFVVSQRDTTITSVGFGTIQFDIRRNRNVPLRVGGRIERLHTKYNYQYIRKGEIILELYTPELNVYTEEYIHHLHTVGDEALVPRAKEKLLLLGVSESQLETLGQIGRVRDTISIYSPLEGYVLFTDNENSSSGMNKMSTYSKVKSMGMTSSAGITSGAAPFTTSVMNSSLREGAYLNKDQTLFYINDFKEAWAVLSFDASLTKYLALNMPVSITTELLDKPLQGVINFIEPVFDNQNQKFVQARVYLKNYDQLLKINTLVKGEIRIDLKGYPIIPSSSVFDLGMRKVVWIKVDETNESHVFEVKTVTIGFQGNGITQIISGLKPGDAIAMDVGYLLDSQSLIEIEKINEIPQ